MRNLDYAIACLGLLTFTFACTGNAIPQTSTANQQAEGRPEHPRREPPPHAYEACKAKKKGDVVDIITPRGEKFKANCTESPKGLFARPERPPEDKAGADRRPPPQQN